MNNYGNALASTGLGAITIGGVVLDQWWLVAVAGGLVGAGVLVLRLGWRRGKDAGQA